MVYDSLLFELPWSIQVMSIGDYTQAMQEWSNPKVSSEFIPSAFLYGNYLGLALLDEFQPASLSLGVNNQQTPWMFLDYGKATDYAGTKAARTVILRSEYYYCQFASRKLYNLGPGGEVLSTAGVTLDQYLENGFKLWLVPEGNGAFSLCVPTTDPTQQAYICLSPFGDNNLTTTQDATARAAFILAPSQPQQTDLVIDQSSASAARSRRARRVDTIVTGPPWTPTTDPQRQQILERFAPEVRLHPDEEYWPCSVDWYLSRVELFVGGMKYVEQPNTDTSEFAAPGQIVIGPPLRVGSEDGNLFPISSDGRELDDYRDPRLGAPAKQADLVYLKQPDNSARRSDLRKGQINFRNTGTKGYPACYAHAVNLQKVGFPVNQEILQIQYWFCFAYDGSLFYKSYGSPSYWGAWYKDADHEADWEHITVMVKPPYQTAADILGAFYSQHDGGHWYRYYDRIGAGETHALVNTARSTHASYCPEHGDNEGFVWSDEVSMNGPVWKAYQNTIEIDYPLINDQMWVGFAGRWGKPPDATEGPVEKSNFWTAEEGTKEFLKTNYPQYLNAQTRDAVQPGDQAGSSHAVYYRVHYGGDPTGIDGVNETGWGSWAADQEVATIRFAGDNQPGLPINAIRLVKGEALSPDIGLLYQVEGVTSDGTAAWTPLVSEGATAGSTLFAYLSAIRIRLTNAANSDSVVYQAYDLNGTSPQTPANPADGAVAGWLAESYGGPGTHLGGISVGVKQAPQSASAAS